MKPILVAGRSGQLARCLVEAAALRGIPLIAIGRPDLDLNDRASIVSVVEAAEPGGIVNAAAYTEVDRAESDPQAAFAVNRDGAARLAAEAHKRAAPFIHVSTDYVFDGLKQSPYIEQDAAAPLNAYGRSKLEGEVAVREACGDALILRTSWLYSPYGRNFVRTMLQKAERQQPVRVVADQRGSPTSAGDLAHAILDVLRELGPGGFGRRAGLYHLAGQGDATWHDLAAAVFTGLAGRGRPLPALTATTTAEHRSVARRPENSRLDCTKIEREFGIRLPSWRDSVDVCLGRLIAGAEFRRC